MDPLRLHCVIFSIIAGGALTLYSAGFGSTHMTDIKINISTPLGLACGDIHYGLFQSCKKMCGTSQDICDDFDDTADTADSVDIIGFKALVIVSYCAFCVSVLGYILPIFIKVPTPIILISSILVTLFAGVLGIIGLTLYVQKRTDAFQEIVESPTSNGTFTQSKAWSYYISVISCAVVILLSPVSGILLRKHSANQSSAQPRVFYH